MAKFEEYTKCEKCSHREVCKGYDAFKGSPDSTKDFPYITFKPHCNQYSGSEYSYNPF